MQQFTQVAVANGPLIRGSILQNGNRLLWSSGIQGSVKPHEKGAILTHRHGHHIATSFVIGIRFPIICHLTRCAVNRNRKNDTDRLVIGIDRPVRGALSINANHLQITSQRPNAHQPPGPRDRDHQAGRRKCRPQAGDDDPA